MEAWHAKKTNKKKTKKKQKNNNNTQHKGKIVHKTLQDGAYLFRNQEMSHDMTADAQADLSLHWAHTHFVGFVKSRLK